MEIQHTLDRPDGAKIGYRLWRTETRRPLLVMLHGLASNLTRWSEFVDHTILKDSWDLLRLDLRGHGTSMYRGEIGLDIWIEDLAAVLSAENYDKAVLIGHSLGAQIAMHFAKRYADKVRALILIDPVFPDALQGTLRKVKNLRWFLWLLIRFVWLLNTLGLRRRHFPPRDLRKLDEQTRATLASDPKADIAKLYTAPHKDMFYLPVANYLQDHYEVSRPVPPCSSIKLPVLVLLSAGATVSEPERNLKIIKEFPHGEIVAINANHWLLTERPREARKAIEEWCTRLLDKI